jgi:hypothetical protein
MDAHHLVDIEEIQQLKARYFRFLCTKQWDQWRDLFTVDATARFHPAPGAEEGELLVGRDAIVAMVSGALADATVVMHGYMPEITITGPDSARGIWSATETIEWPPEVGYPSHRTSGYYFETYALVGGSWKITEVRMSRLRHEVLTPSDG